MKSTQTLSKTKTAPKRRPSSACSVASAKLTNIFCDVCDKWGIVKAKTWDELKIKVRAHGWAILRDGTVLCQKHKPQNDRTNNEDATKAESATENR